MRKEKIMGTQVSIATTFNPLLFVNNVITIEDDFYRFKREKFIIQSISYTIGDSNQITISCANINDTNMIENDMEKYLLNNITINTPYGGYNLVLGW